MADTKTLEAVQKAVEEARAKGHTLLLQYADKPILTFEKSGVLRIHTTDSELLQLGMMVLTQELDKLFKEREELAGREAAMLISLGALRGWLKSVDPGADERGRLKDKPVRSDDLLINMPSSKGKN